MGVGRGGREVEVEREGVWVKRSSFTARTMTDTSNSIRLIVYQRIPVADQVRTGSKHTEGSEARYLLGQDKKQTATTTKTANFRAKSPLSSYSTT